jgi:phosphohistidine phosphatase
MSKQLIIFRHAKSSWGSAMLDDFSRPLSERGVESAKLMGATLKKMDISPDCIHLSSSVRTEETCELFLQASELKDIPCHASRNLYHAGYSTLLSSIHSFDNAYSRVMLIGHNLGLEALLLHFCPDAPMSNGKLLTTANVAVIDFDAHDWGSIGKQATLLCLLRPKEISQETL